MRNDSRISVNGKSSQGSNAQMLSLTQQPVIHERKNTDSPSIIVIGKIEQECVEPLAKRSRRSGRNPKSKGGRCAA